MSYLQFTTGQVLTSTAMNQVGDSLVNVFASASARNSAISSPSEGMICYLSDSDTLQTYSGSAWVDVGGGAMTQLGTVSLSGVSSASVDSIASGYRYLHCEWSATIGSSDQLYLVFRVGGSDQSNFVHNGSMFGPSSISDVGSGGLLGIQLTGTAYTGTYTTGAFSIFNYANATGSTYPIAFGASQFNFVSSQQGMGYFSGASGGPYQLNGVKIRTLSTTLATDTNAHLTVYGVE